MRIPHWFTALAGYVRGPLTSACSDFGNAVRDEIEFHLAERTREYLEQGMTDAEARRAAIHRFGSTARVAAECHAAAFTDQVVWHRLHQLLTVGLVVAVAALCVVSRPSGGAMLPPPIASMVDNDWTGDVTGSVRDDQDRPIPGAHVLIVVKTWPDKSYFQRAYPLTTDTSGRFTLEDVYPTNDEYEVQIAAVAEYRVLESSYHQQPGGTLEPVRFQLGSAAFFAVRVESASGKALPGIEVFPHGRLTHDGNDHVVYFDSAGSIIRRTNADGNVELPYFQSGETATVYVHPPGSEWEVHEVTVPPLGKVVRIQTNALATDLSEETRS